MDRVVLLRMTRRLSVSSVRRRWHRKPSQRKSPKIDPIRRETRQRTAEVILRQLGALAHRTGQKSLAERAIGNKPRPSADIATREQVKPPRQLLRPADSRGRRDLPYIICRTLSVAGRLSILIDVPFGICLRDSPLQGRRIHPTKG